MIVGSVRVKIRNVISLRGESALAHVIRHATYPDDFSLTQQSYHSLLQKMLLALRASNHEAIYTDILEVKSSGTTKDISVDLRNTQWIGADRAISCFSKGYEPEILACIEAFTPNDGVFVDVGSNWGYFSIYLALRSGFSGKIIAIEPFPTSYKDLLTLIQTLNLGRYIAAFPIAAGHKAHRSVISDELYSGVNALREVGEGYVTYVERLDHIVQAEGLERVDVMKVDVEGHEREALSGAAACISRHQPVIVFESWLLPSREEVIAPFEEILKASRSYRFYLMKDISVAPCEDGDELLLTGNLQEISPEDRLTEEERVNVIAIPEGSSLDNLK